MKFRYAKMLMAKCNRPMVQLHVLALVFLLAAGFTSLMPITGMAADEATESATASANIWAAISIREDSALNFGKIIAPTSGSNTFTLVCAAAGCPTNSATVTMTGAGNGHKLGQDGTIGRFFIAGEDNKELQLGITYPSDCTGDGLVAVVVFILGLPPHTNKDLTTRGDLQVTAGPVTPGVHTCSYVISASYLSPP